MKITNNQIGLLLLTMVLIGPVAFVVNTFLGGGGSPTPQEEKPVPIEKQLSTKALGILVNSNLMKPEDIAGMRERVATRRADGGWSAPIADRRFPGKLWWVYFDSAGNLEEIRHPHQF